MAADVAPSLPVPPTSPERLCGCDLDLDESSPRRRRAPIDVAMARRPTLPLATSGHAAVGVHPDKPTSIVKCRQVPVSVQDIHVGIKTAIEFAVSGTLVPLVTDSHSVTPGGSSRRNAIL